MEVPQQCGFNLSKRQQGKHENVGIAYSLADSCVKASQELYCDGDGSAEEYEDEGVEAVDCHHLVDEGSPIAADIVLIPDDAKVESGGDQQAEYLTYSREPEE